MKGVIYCGKRELKRLGFVTGCYPMGKGQGLLLARNSKQVIADAEKAGWTVSRLCGVGHDYNLDGDIMRVYKEEKE